MQKDIYRNWRDLIRPKRLVVDKESLTPTYGKFFAEPLQFVDKIDWSFSLARQLLTCSKEHFDSAHNLVHATVF